MCWILRGITPACAGNTFLLFLLCSRVGDHPRMRGEYGFVNENGELNEGSPPHARGIRRPGCTDPGPGGITPACAGNTKISSSGVLSRRDHPRMRGEYLVSRLSVGDVTGSPPHARGILDIFVYRDPDPGDHPRMRGEY